MQQVIDCSQGEIRGVYPVVAPDAKTKSKYYFDTDFTVSNETLAHCKTVAGMHPEILGVTHSDNSQFGGIMVIFKTNASKELILMTIGAYVSNLRKHFNKLDAEAKAAAATPVRVINEVDPVVAAMAVNAMPRNFRRDE